jgi:hypothetical protein
MLLMISWGEMPRASCDATCDDKQMGEVNRVLPASHKSAEPVKAGRAGTSDPVSGPASELAMARETEPMADAPFKYGTRRLGSGRVGRRRKPQAGEALVRGGLTRTGGTRLAARQPWHGFAWCRGRISHGV